MPDDLAGKPPLDLPSDQDASGRSFGAEELELLRAALDSGVLTATRGRFVRTLERRVARMLDLGHAVACGSGTTAIHAAVAAIDPEPGEEIVTSPITDMGAIAPILYRGAIPVFADVDPATGNVTADSVADVLSEGTRAIVVTHLFGNPAGIEPIVRRAAARGIPVIEDCAQAWGATVGARTVGSFGAIGCFSLQQGKHITCGEGGIAVTGDAALARRLRLFIDKGWPYGEAAPDHEFLALNGRMSELQGAVALAQLDRLADGVAHRRAAAARLDRHLAGIPGIAAPAAAADARHSYWRYLLTVDPAEVPGGAEALGRALRARGVAALPRYIGKPAFQCAVFRDRRTFGTSAWPFTLARPEALDYDPARFPGVFAALERMVVLPWNERLSEADVDALGGAIRVCCETLRR